ncbi:MAG TPA: TraR/DksA family transcriptional regulator [Planctomycetota bacterium]
MKKDYKAILLELRRVLTGDVRGLETGACGTESSGDISENPAEQATDNAEQAISLGRMESQTREIREIDEALERVKDGTFGVCEDCGKAVPAARLEAIPYARLCAACQVKVEENSGQ